MQLREGLGPGADAPLSLRQLQQCAGQREGLGVLGAVRFHGEGRHGARRPGAERRLLHFGKHHARDRRRLLALAVRGAGRAQALGAGLAVLRQPGGEQKVRGDFVGQGEQHRRHRRRRRRQAGPRRRCRQQLNAGACGLLGSELGRRADEAALPRPAPGGEPRGRARRGTVDRGRGRHEPTRHPRRDLRAPRRKVPQRGHGEAPYLRAGRFDEAGCAGQFARAHGLALRRGGNGRALQAPSAHRGDPRSQESRRRDLAATLRRVVADGREERAV
mmetsp:Transcript_108526/g.312645  ORF Transcript_108526/g.312645 Transcript_108526/m.312645 type:complete len:274 (-) Transcript_108526:1053-1874(-)